MIICGEGRELGAGVYSGSERRESQSDGAARSEVGSGARGREDRQVFQFRRTVSTGLETRGMVASFQRGVSAGARPRV